MTENQQVRFLTDGGEDIRDLPYYLNAQGEPRALETSDDGQDRQLPGPRAVARSWSPGDRQRGQQVFG